MDKQVTITFPVLKCKCGVHGDILISINDFDIDHVWCTVCGERIPEPEKEKK